MERTHVLYGVCRQCKAIIARVVNPSPNDRMAMQARDLIMRDLFVDDAEKWQATTCLHHGG